MHGERGTQVEIRSAPDESVLHLRLLDEQKVEIDSADLKSTVDFELSRGVLSLHGPFAGTRARSTNLGTGIEHQSSQLYLSSTSDLFGRKSDSGAALLFYVVPVIGSSKDCMLWLKLPSK